MHQSTSDFFIREYQLSGLADKFIMLKFMYLIVRNWQDNKITACHWFQYSK